MTKILFILKRREDFNAIIHSQVGVSTGLFNSASFVNDMLNNKKIESKVVVVSDNNDIDREVTAYRPTHVIIEALWVVPSKFTVLEKLHPSVNWIIRLHSELPFMANEGIAMDWLGDYSKFKNVYIGINAPRMLREIKNYLKIVNNWSDHETNRKVFYLPNYYPIKEFKKTNFVDKDYVDVSCFGAIRPLKNHLLQAFAAIEFANKINKKLHFHINAGRIEMKGEPVVNNLKGLFQQIYDSGHKLVNHEWTPREQFVELCGTMDIGLQVSFSETFNIVAADHIIKGVPIVGSSEIPWSANMFNANPVDSNSIVNALILTYNTKSLNVKTHKYNLDRYVKNTEKIWVNYFKG